MHSSSIISLLVGSGCLLWIYNQAMVALGKRKASQPFVISMAAKFLSHEEHEKHVKHVEHRLDDAALSRKHLHEHIESIGVRTARLEEQTKSQTDSIQLLSSDSREFFREQRAINNEVLKRLPK